MALSQKTKDILVVAMASKVVAEEIIAKIESHDTESGDPALLAAWESAQQDSADALAAQNAAEQAYLDALAADPDDPNLPNLLSDYEAAQDAYAAAQDAESDAQAAYEASIVPGPGLVSEETKKVMIVAFSNEKIAEEIVSVINTGAPLSHEAKRYILIALASSEAGNEFINEIQTIKTAPISL